ncbi:MAG: membrane protein insertion efficiency factor YidD [Patescibacteria group bacterium]|nr:membrane protein insertion efficiency factor YidD [Patescibacteria group bacterium]
MKHLALFAITLYQKTLSPDHGPLKGFFGQGACKYYPTCSQYSYDAIRAHGVRKGFALGLKRVLRCHPWAQGGYDPVLHP